MLFPIVTFSMLALFLKTPVVPILSTFITSSPTRNASGITISVSVPV
jgi:hypothetical protein